MKGNARKYSNCSEIYQRLKQYLSEIYSDAGERIPPERKIAEDLSVNRNTLRNAIHMMVKEGYLERHVGVGTFYKVAPEDIFKQDSENKYNLEEIMEMRLLFEPQITVCAIYNLSQENIRNIHEICDINGDYDPLGIEKRDIEFNEYLSRLNHNKFFCDVFIDLLEARRSLENCDSGEKNIPIFDDLQVWKKYQFNIIEAAARKNSAEAEKATKEKISFLINFIS